MRRLLLLAGLALVLAGCGEAGSEAGPAGPPALSSAETETIGAAPAGAGGAEAPPAPQESAPVEPTATPASAPVETPVDNDSVVVWVTQGAGAELVLEGRVDPGRTAIQAVAALAEVDTRYGGRYVSGIEGLSSDLDGQSDWFFLVNGIEPDVGAAEVKVEAGDVVWWDYRGWADGAPHPAAVVGAFPRPFHRGWKGAVRPVEVDAPAELTDLAAELEAFLTPGAPDDRDAKPHRFVLEIQPGATAAELSASMGSRNGSPVTFVLAGNETAVRAAGEALIASPEIVAYRYTATFDDAGQVLDE